MYYGMQVPKSRGKDSCDDGEGNRYRRSKSGEMNERDFLEKVMVPKVNECQVAKDFDVEIGLGRRLKRYV